MPHVKAGKDRFVLSLSGQEEETLHKAFDIVEQVRKTMVHLYRGCIFDAEVDQNWGMAQESLGDILDQLNEGDGKMFFPLPLD